jgi:iron complex transport system substrate-binding protein
MFKRFIWIAIVVMLVTLSATTAAQEVIPLDECVTEYDAAVNYFPDDVSMEYAQGFTVEYFNHYKVVTSTLPWPGATAADAFQYVLVQCGTPAPEGFEDAQMIEVPVQRVISMSTTYLPALTELDVLDRLIGLDGYSVLYTNAPEVQALIEAGTLVDIGNAPTINVEAALDAEPDLILAYGSGLPEFDAHPVLLEAGIPVALASDYVEESPLGRAEWMKFIALFFNKEAEAEALFNEKVTAYNDLVALTAALPLTEKPTVLWDSFSSYGSAWFIPGGRSFVGQLLRDAGAITILGDNPMVVDEVASVPFDFETVYDAGLEADYWFANAFLTNTLADLMAQDERYAGFTAVEAGRVYNNDAVVNANGGNDYYESGAANPQLVLADLVAILHPDLLPEHTLRYYRPLE